MSRLTVRDIRLSRIPQTIGVNPSDTPTLCSFLNEAIERLVKAGGESGWWGGWATMAFNVDPNNPYITVPPEVARVISFDICRKPIRIQNQFYEYLEFGYGIAKSFIGIAGCENSRCCQFEEVYDRGTFPTLVDIPAGNKLRVYMTNVQDAKKRLFYTGKDTNDQKIYTIDNAVQTDGAFISFEGPFADSAYALNELTGLIKDTTLGPIRLMGVNTSTGIETLLATLAPRQPNPAFRRYFLNGLPSRCCDCDSTSGIVQVNAIVKLEYVPVSTDTDFLLIGNINALKRECMAVRYSEMDVTGAQALEIKNHAQAITILNEELTHYMGRSKIAVKCSPFGNATLERAGLSTMI